MSGIETLFQQPWVMRAGWALVHFLWQGSAIAILLAVVRGFAGRWLSARGRYALSCAALALMAVAPLATFLASGNPAVAALPRPVWPVAGGDTWERLLPWFVVVWLIGVVVFSARIAVGWRLAARLRRVAAGPVPRAWQQALDELIHSMRVAAPVRLLGSALAPAPAVVGWLRPVILMPIEALAGLPIEQVRALLAHELAHVLRNDYLVNILQSIAEAVLFYHPAVWWVSGQIRVERELCCDDLAVEASGDVLTYATALADLDSRRRARLRAVLAANGGSLVHRIRRLAGKSEPVSHNLPSFGAVWALSILWLAGIGAVALHAGQTPPARVALRPFTPVGIAAAPPAVLPAPPSIKVSPAPPMLAALLFDPLFAPPQAPAPPAPNVDSARAKALLESPRLADKAWGAYLATQLHDPVLQDALIAQLHWAESLREAPANGEGFACIQSLLDALIQLGAVVPVQAILPYATRWRAEALILLASRTTDADEADLLAMREKDLNEAEWLVVNNLLLRRRSAAFFAKTLQEIHVTHTFVVSDTGVAPGEGRGGSFGRGGPNVGFPKGFPPIAIYQLEIAQWGTPPPGADDVLVIKGPMNQGDVFYRRTVVPADGTAPNLGRNFRDTDRQIYRRAYMAELGGLSMGEAGKLFCPTTNVRWRSPEDFAHEADLALGSRADRVHEFVLAAEREGLGNVGGMRLEIDPVIKDYRSSPESPLPPLGPKEIKLD